MKNSSKDPIILNEANKIKEDILYDLEFEVNDYVFDTQDSMVGGFNDFKYEFRPHEESEK